MPHEYSPIRSEEYRARAAETRAKAVATNDMVAQAVLLQGADTWERMAAWMDQIHTRRAAGAAP